MFSVGFMYSASALRANKLTARVISISSCIQPYKIDKFLDCGASSGKNFSTCTNLYSKELVASAEEKRLSNIKKVTKKVTEVVKKNPIVEYVQGIQRNLHFKVSKHELSQAAYFTYEDLIDMIPVEQFFMEFEMPDTFASWFTVIELHLWMISARLMKEETIGYYARDMLTTAFFQDVCHRSSLLGHRASLYRQKQVAILGYQFTAAYYGYDEGLQSNDKVLAAIVWRRFFGFECDDAEKIERVVKYIRVQMDHLCFLTFDDIMFKRKDLIIPLSKVQIE